MSTPSNTEYSFLLPDNVVDLAWKMSQKEVERFAGSNGHYGSPAGNSELSGNDINVHFTGKCGELAAYAVFSTKGCKPVLNSTTDFNKSDLSVTVNGKLLRVEVKACVEQNWDKYSRVVTRSQFKNVAKKADVVVWVSVKKRLGWDAENKCAKMSVNTTIVGWNTVEDVAAAKVNKHFNNEVIQVAQKDVRKMDDLFVLE